MKRFALTLTCICSFMTLQGQVPSNDVQINIKPMAPTSLAPDPYTQLRIELASAKNKGMPYADTGILATAGSDCTPHARTLSISKITPEGIVFFTNPDSGKWQQMQENQKASFALFFHEVEPCIVINGIVDLNYVDNQSKEHIVTINGEKIPVAWQGFLLRPTEFQFSGRLVKQSGYNVTPSYLYTKDSNGNWKLAPHAKYYVMPQETRLFPEQ